MPQLIAPTTGGIALLAEYRQAIRDEAAALRGAMFETLLKFAISTGEANGERQTEKKKKIVAARLRPAKALAGNLALGMYKGLDEAISFYMGEHDGITPTRAAELEMAMIDIQCDMIKEDKKNEDLLHGRGGEPGRQDLIHARVAQFMGGKLLCEGHQRAFKFEPKMLKLADGDVTYILRNDMYPASAGLGMAQSVSTRIYSQIVGRVLDIAPDQRNSADMYGTPIDGVAIASPAIADLLERTVAVPSTSAAQRRRNMN